MLTPYAEGRLLCFYRAFIIIIIIPLHFLAETVIMWSQHFRMMRKQQKINDSKMEHVEAR